ncbi:MAG: hypothetical protein WCE64_00395 [Bacteroidales bacterium]
MRIIVAFLITLFIVPLYSQEEKSWSIWQKNAPDPAAIPAGSYGFFKKGNLYYYISNDDRFLYLFMKIEDSGVEYKILQEGFSVWINEAGKNQKKTGIRFPIGAKLAAKQGNADTESPIAMANKIQLIGFGNQEKSIIPASNPDDFHGFVKYDDQGILHYLLCMPVSRLSLTNNQPFSLGLEYGGTVTTGNPEPPQMPPAEAGGMPSGGRGGRSGGGSRGGGGGMPGGMGRPSAMSAPAAEQSKLMWIKNIKLSQPQ